MLGANVVDALALALLDPHVPAARAAAEALFAAPFHLHQLQSGYGVSDQTWRFVDSVVSAEVAGVVIGDRSIKLDDRPDLALLDQVRDELAVVHHLVVTAEVRILVLYRVKAVGARSHYLLDVIFLERLDVLLRQRLVQVLVAHSSRGVSGAGLLVAQDSEVHFGPLEYGRHRARDSLASLLQRRRASYPEQDLCLGMLSQGPYIETFGPIRAAVGGATPGVASLLHAQQGVHGRLRHLCLFHHQIPTHVDYRVDVLYADGALLHAGAARQAVPEHLLLYPTADERLRLLLVVSIGETRAQFKNVLLQVLDDVHGREELAADVGGADVRAATANSTGVAVENLPLREVLNAKGAEHLCRFQVQRRAQGASRLKRPREEVYGGRDQVHVL